MTDMTPEQLDAWRAEKAIEEAEPQYGYTTWTKSAATIAARLAREDVRPVNADVLAVREICAQESEAQLIGMGGVFRSGEADADRVMRCALAAYRAGREAGR